MNVNVTHLKLKPMALNSGGFGVEIQISNEHMDELVPHVSYKPWMLNLTKYILDNRVKPFPNKDIYDPLPALVCKDGYKISLQAGRSHFCFPRTNNPGDQGWSSFELYLPVHDEIVNDYGTPDDPDNPPEGHGFDGIYPFVPYDVVVKLIEKHGPPDDFPKGGYFHDRKRRQGYFGSIIIGKRAIRFALGEMEKPWQNRLLPYWDDGMYLVKLSPGGMIVSLHGAKDRFYFNLPGKQFARLLLEMCKIAEQSGQDVYHQPFDFMDWVRIWKVQYAPRWRWEVRGGYGKRTTASQLLIDLTNPDQENLYDELKRLDETCRNGSNGDEWVIMISLDNFKKSRMIPHSYYWEIWTGEGKRAWNGGINAFQNRQDGMWEYRTNT